MEPLSREPKPRTAMPSQEDIRTRAYHIYLSRGSTPGSPESDWLEAERQLMEEAARADVQTVPTPAPIEASEPPTRLRFAAADKAAKEQPVTSAKASPPRRARSKNLR